jgi:hypothetical protein
MDVETDANAANVAELQAHINLASKRASALTPGTAKADDSLETLTDYYERLVQIRSMTIATLQETAIDTATAHKSAVRWWRAAAGFFCVVAANALVCLAPDAARAAADVAAPYLTIDRLVTHALVAIVFLYGSRRAFA